MGIVKRGKSYGARVHLGGNKYVWLGTFATRRDAKEALRQAESKPNVRGTETCDSFAERWTRDYPRPQESSNRTNAALVKRFARDFKGIRLRDVDRSTA